MSYKRSCEEKRRLLKLYNETSNQIMCGVWYDSKAGRYKRYSMSYKSGYPRYLKKLCNKRIRKYLGSLKRNEYRKVSEYTWMLY